MILVNTDWMSALEVGDLLDRLVVHLRALNAGADRVPEEAKLTDVASHGDIYSFTKEVQARVGGGEVPSEPAVHQRVKKLRALREEDLPNVDESKADILHRHRHRHSLEVSPIVHPAGLRVDEGVVRRRVRLDRDRL